MADVKRRMEEDMYKEKNYNAWYMFSLVLLVLTTVVHIAGYFTNILYVLAWALWMPLIALYAVMFFDIKNSSVVQRNKIFSKESIKNIRFAIVVVTAVYVIFNLVYCFGMLSEISDIKTVDGIYYAISADNKMNEISYNEYVNYSLASYRMLSGHGIVFIAAAWWYYGEKKKKNSK